MKEKLFTRNFTFLVLGQVSSLIGNDTLKFALAMYVLDQTGSAAVFATLMAVAMVPTILLSPFGGMIADRLNRRNIMVALDALSGISVLLAFLLFREEISIPLIGGLLVVLSVFGAFETPTVQACIPQMLSGENILKGNGVVNQVAAFTGLVTPFVGSVVYVAFGIRPVLLATMICFFITASLECFIRLEYHKSAKKQKIMEIVREDFAASMHFLRKEQPSVLTLLLLAAMVSFFVIGTVLVGFPFLVRRVLGLSATHYGVAESAMGVAAILGSVSVGLLANKLRLSKLHWLIIALGLCFIPAGGVFLMPVSAFSKYLVLVLAFGGGQMVCMVFSIFAVSAIQERTPQHLAGKVMAVVMTISMCARPLGQVMYGFLFDAFVGRVHLVLIPTGLVICAIGGLSTGFFTQQQMQHVSHELPQQ